MFTPMPNASTPAVALEHLRRQSRSGSLKLRADLKDGRIVFSGGTQGVHSIDAGLSSAQRVLAHWEGYCENNGMALPVVGQRVEFVGNNGCLYYGTVTHVGPKRVGVDFKYRHGGKGKANMRHSQIRFNIARG